MDYVIIKETCENLEYRVNKRLAKGFVLYGHPFLAGTKHKVPGQEVPEPILCQAMTRTVEKDRMKRPPMPEDAEGDKEDP